jgi:hypothetical protein
LQILDFIVTHGFTLAVRDTCRKKKGTHLFRLYGGRD